MNPPGASSSWYQLAGNAYAPFGAVLTDSTGDMIFGINFSTTALLSDFTPVGDYSYASIAIYLPPEFTPPVDWTAADTSNIVTTITNDYAQIWVMKTDVKDPFGPGNWVIYIGAGGGYPFDVTGRMTAKSAAPAAAGATTSPRMIQFTGTNHYQEWYYVRVNGMKAPSIAGRYFFKMFLSDHYPTGNAITSAGASIFATTTTTNGFPSTMPAENYPVMLVKGEVDPGIIEGTVRYGAWNQLLYNLPIQLPGRVRAVGVADDPYTGASTGRAVEARGYFNASAKGHYEVEGVAPGVYDIYASEPDTQK